MLHACYVNGDKIGAGPSQNQTAKRPDLPEIAVRTGQHIT